MTLSRRQFVVGSVATGSIGAYGGRSSAQEPRADRIVLGQSVALTGPLGVLGTEYRAGALRCFESVNAAGGVHGRRIELRSLDDGYQTELALANTKRLVEVDRVFAIFGQFGTGITAACLPLTTAVGVPLFAPFTGADALRDDGNRNLFHLRASYGQEMRQIVDHLVTTGVRRIGVAYQGDSFGRAGLDGVTRALSHHGLSPDSVGEMTIVPKVDVERAAATVASKSPAAVVLSTSGKGAVAFIRRFQEIGARTQFYGMSVVSSRELAAELGPAARGIVISQVVPSPWRTQVALAREFQLALRDKLQPSYGAMEGFVAARVLVEGLKRAGRQLTREALIQGLESMADWDAGGFRVSYSPSKRTGSSFVELSMLNADGSFLR